MLARLIYDLGEPWCYNHQFDFGLESADKVCDFYNNGGMEIHHEDSGENVSIAYAAVRWIDDNIITVTLGCWIWYDGQTFEDGADWMELNESDFEDDELIDIYRKIKEIYEKELH